MSMLFYMTFPLFSNRCYDAPKNSPKFNKCIKKVENICQSHKIRALKVLRYSIFSLQKMMTSNPDLVIIYLMRDPRAVMWSRTKTFGYPRKEVRGKISVSCEDAMQILPMRISQRDKMYKLTLAETLKGFINFIDSQRLALHMNCRGRPISIRSVSIRSFSIQKGPISIRSFSIHNGREKNFDNIS